jgi:hypothetical protein
VGRLALQWFRACFEADWRRGERQRQEKREAGGDGKVPVAS